MEVAQKILQLEAEKNQLVQQAIITENNLQGLRQQVSFIDGQLTELKLILPKKDDKTKKTKSSKAD